ncbi:DUF2577 domain-containing protein [Bacillus sp. FJAT-42376]|nr:DUF2577 domain-containing protein [Bacillus sp. FJAT-42376]
MRLIGNGYSNLAEVIKKVGHNRDVDLMIGKVIAPLPDIKVKYDDNPNSLVFEAEDLIIEESLLERTEIVEINGQPATIKYPHKLTTDDRVYLVSINEQQTWLILGKAIIPDERGMNE